MERELDSVGGFPMDESTKLISLYNVDSRRIALRIFLIEVK